MTEFDQNGLPAGYQFKPQYEISPRALRELRADPRQSQRVLIVDVRLASEVDAAAITPSVHIPLHELEQRIDEILEVAADRQVVTLCHHGVRSLRASLFLCAAGLPGTLSMAGGIDAWSSIDPSVPRYERNGSQVKIIR